MPDLPFTTDVQLELLLASPLHRYEGRPSDGPIEATTREAHESIEVRAGKGIVGDRYFGHAAHVTASVTIFAAESLEHVARVLELDRVPDAIDARRNIVVRGIDVDRLRGATFSLDSGDGPVLFRAHRPANPCAWMNVMLAPGAHKALRNRGGMRCEPLSSGTLRLGAATFASSVDVALPTVLW